MDTERPGPQRPGIPGEDDAWLARPSTIRLLWWVFAAVLALSSLARARPQYRKRVAYTRPLEA